MYFQWIEEELLFEKLDFAYETALFTIDEESELTNIRNDYGLKLQYFKLVEDVEAELKLKKTKVNVDS